MNRSKRNATLFNPRVEARLVQVAEELPGQRILATSVGSAPAAHRLASERFDARVCCWILDACQAQRATSTETASARTKIFCQADCPEFPCDLALVPLSAQRPAELARDLLQSTYHQLETGGRLVVAVDDPKDRWVLQQLQTFTKSIKSHAFDDAKVYVARKLKPLKKLKDFSCELVFRDAGRLVHLFTRPGVFAHRQLDNGARQLLDNVAPAPQSRILDLGCGSGAVALALACRDQSHFVVALDSHSRAIDCVHRGAARNAVTNIQAVLACADHWQPADPFDLVTANPPYYASDRLAGIFMEAARRALRPGGRVFVVTKHADWYRQNLPRWFDRCSVEPSRRYFIATGQAR